MYTIDPAIPTKLVKNAVLRPDNRDSILPSMFLGSKSINPTTIPAKVPKIPREVNRLAVLPVNLGAFPIAERTMETIINAAIIRINASDIAFALNDAMKEAIWSVIGIFYRCEFKRAEFYIYNIGFRNKIIVLFTYNTGDDYMHFE
ncbi:hypothetical protein VS_1366 [Vibrio atlanticus]|uniref:Uncharacterized protein n=1 Tax=Vibrio atlanticus (strain LGP32) TaxID=575788 RepID=B7VNF3_VIBA3|nr:hypothetical protein VS_1366 [Vibrio atlanticus]